jgi:aspartate/methionine/tyrosine aminotransferase
MGVSVLEAGDTVFVESPTYDRVLTLFKRHGINVVGIPLEPDGINLEAFTKALENHKPKIVYLIADFQNPSGATMSLSKRQAVVELAAKHDFLILEDAPYRPLRYRGTQIASLRELNPERVMQMSSYTKQISPGVRVGSLVGPAKPLAQQRFWGKPLWQNSYSAACSSLNWRACATCTVLDSRRLLPHSRHTFRMPVLSNLTAGFSCPSHYLKARA